MKLIITDRKDLKINIEGEYKLIEPNDSIKRCIGCFGCWNRTPGRCVLKDEFNRIGEYMGHCDEIILISKCVYGSVSPFVKAIQDRGISYVTCDFADINGEMHHKRRYYNHVSYSAYIYGEDITEEEKDTMRALIKANSVNFYGDVKCVNFYKSVEELEGIKI